MAQPRVRPTFDRPLPTGPRAFLDALRHALARAEGPCRGRVFDDGAILRIDREAREIWSPALHLHVSGDDERAVELHARFSPSSPVWTAFIALYLALACVGIATICYGFVQISLGQSAWAFLGVPAVLALAGFVYGAAFIGQGLGAEDMYELRSFVDRVIDALPAVDDPVDSPR